MKSVVLYAASVAAIAVVSLVLGFSPKVDAAKTITVASITGPESMCYTDDFVGWKEIRGHAKVNEHGHMNIFVTEYRNIEDRSLILIWTHKLNIDNPDLEPTCTFTIKKKTKYNTDRGT